MYNDSTVVKKVIYPTRLCNFDTYIGLKNLCKYTVSQNLHNGTC